mmetsp:Transcript_73479/g.116395  ORF Transcript_73479/g.116395 Transcript_73479/m.116395 type:complete len:344 (-) Transcript_73479:499-1530(-)
MSSIPPTVIHSATVPANANTWRTSSGSSAKMCVTGLSAGVYALHTPQYAACGSISASIASSRTTTGMSSSFRLPSSESWLVAGLYLRPLLQLGAMASGKCPSSLRSPKRKEAAPKRSSSTFIRSTYCLFFCAVNSRTCSCLGLKRAAMDGGNFAFTFSSSSSESGIHNVFISTSAATLSIGGCRTDKSIALAALSCPHAINEAQDADLLVACLTDTNKSPRDVHATCTMLGSAGNFTHCPTPGVAPLSASTGVMRVPRCMSPSKPTLAESLSKASPNTFNSSSFFRRVFAAVNSSIVTLEMSAVAKSHIRSFAYAASMIIASSPAALTRPVSGMLMTLMSRRF